MPRLSGHNRDCIVGIRDVELGEEAPLVEVGMVLDDNRNVFGEPLSPFKLVTL